MRYLRLTDETAEAVLGLEARHVVAVRAVLGRYRHPRTVEQAKDADALQYVEDLLGALRDLAANETEAPPGVVEPEEDPTLECPYCGHGHDRLMCPRVTAVDYFEDGRVKSVGLARREDHWRIMGPPEVAGKPPGTMVPTGGVR